MAGLCAPHACNPRIAGRIRLVPILVCLTLFGGVPEYRSVSVDQSGQLHIVLDSGKEILARKVSGQASFDHPLISPDQRTVGWLAMYPDPTVDYDKGAEIAGKLVIYQADRIRFTFSTEQVFWDWQFQDGGKRVAYSVGPTHGGAVEGVLRDVDSGLVVASWRVNSGSPPPDWVRTLRQ